MNLVVTKVTENLQNQQSLQQDISNPNILFIQTTYIDSRHLNSRIDPQSTKIFRQSSIRITPELILDLTTYISGAPYTDNYEATNIRNYNTSNDGKYLTISLGSKLLLVDMGSKLVRTIPSPLNTYIISTQFGQDNKLLVIRMNQKTNNCWVSQINTDSLRENKLKDLPNPDCPFYYFLGWQYKSVYMGISIPAEGDAGAHGTTLNLQTNTLQDTPGDPIFFDQSDSGKLLVVPSPNGQLSIIDIFTGQRLITVGQVNEMPKIMAFSPNEDQILYLTDKKEIKLLSINNKTIQDVDNPELIINSWKKFDRTWKVIPIQPNIKSDEKTITQTIARYYQ